MTATQQSGGIQRRIHSVTINGLFGLFDHTVNLRTKDHITIIHGPNGVGKTTILRLVDCLFGKKFSRVSRIPFTSANVVFTSRERLEITQKSNLLVLELHPGRRRKKQTYEIEFGAKKDSPSERPLVSMLEDYTPLERIGTDTWADPHRGDIVDFEEALDRYRSQIPYRVPHAREIPDWTDALLSSVNTHFIETQRLAMNRMANRGSRRYKQEIRSAVDACAMDMVRRLGEAQRKSGVVGTALDRNFPKRLLDRKTKPPTESALRKTYEKQTQYQQRLMAAGLIDDGAVVSLPEKNITAAERKVLHLHLNDVKKKTAVFEDLLVRAELFEQILNTRFRYKRLEVNRSRGIQIRAAKPPYNFIPLDGLSSGEQHELIMAYKLLFNARPGDFIMIDEPELSLHVSWQRKFLDDIKKIAKLSGLDFLIATHSPSIVNRHRNLMEDLGGDDV